MRVFRQAKGGYSEVIVLAYFSVLDICVDIPLISWGYIA